MTRKSAKSVHSQSLRDLAELIVATAGTGSTTNNSQDPIRRAALKLGKRTALNLDSHWKRARNVDGPIDVIDMFSGCGGMSAGFMAVNGAIPAYRLVMAVDIAAKANSTYEQNLGVKPLQIDIGSLANEPGLLEKAIKSSRRRPGHPLVLIGCAPCQGFSSHRNADGESDDRNNLFVQFATIAAKLEPDAIVVENVPELLTDRYWRYREIAKGMLEQRGYHVYVSVHNMAEFGVPQERFRTLLLAMKKPFTPPAPILSRPKFRTVHDAIGGLPEIAAGEISPVDSMHYTAGHRESTLETIRQIPKDGGNRPPNVGPDCLRRFHARQGKAAYEDVYGRLFWRKPSITITAFARNPASGRYVHPDQNRGLSVREVALLQGFPKDFWFQGSLDERFRQVGNAVPPIFASFLAMHVLGELLAQPASEPLDRGITEPVGPSFARLIPALKAGTRRISELR
jgi:DNA (cytosine-5)-methyltransferase 1